MDQLGPADMAFGTGDIDGLGFPSPDEHITTTGGHCLPTESLTTHNRHGQNELMFPGTQLDISEYENGLTQNVGMAPLDPVMNTDVRSLSMDNMQNRSEPEMGHLMKPRHPFTGEGSGPRAYTMNQLHGFQQIQQTQPIGTGHSMTSNIQQMYPPRNEQSFQAPHFDVNAFLNTRQPPQQVVPPTCTMSQLPYVSNNYVESNHMANQPQSPAVHQQFLGQNIKSSVTTDSSTMQTRLLPTSGISAMLPGIKSENIDSSCSRRQRHPLPPISQALNGAILNQHRIPSDIFGMVADALPSLKLPPSAPDDLVSQGLPIDQRMLTAQSPGPVNTLLPMHQNERLPADVMYQVNGTRKGSLDQIPQPNCNDIREGDEVSSASEDDDGTEDDKDEDYVPHMEDIAYKHKKLMKARQHKGIRHQHIQSKSPEIRVMREITQQQPMQEQLVDQISGFRDEVQTTPKKNPIEGITLDVGPDGTTSLKVNFVPGQTMAEELVAAFQNVLEKQLKHGQEDVENGCNQSAITNQNVDVPSVLELSFKLTTPEKTRTLAGTVKEYDKPKRSWKERAHHEQEEKADGGLGPGAIPHSNVPITIATDKEETGHTGEQKLHDESASKDKAENEDSQGMF